MNHSGTVYKFTGNIGHIRANEWTDSRKDVLFKKTEYDLKLGDKVNYMFQETNGRRHVIELEKQ